MKNEILVAMASDMKITKYESESDAQYTQRVLYSALACWIKAATLDRDMSQPNSVGASKKHIKEKCTQILEATLDRIPEARGYFSWLMRKQNPFWKNGQIFRSGNLQHFC
mgnify:CR=1 FL=1